MASQPTSDDGEECLEELDLDEAAVISHQSEVHAPARRQNVRVDERSIVVSDEPGPNARRHATTRRRALEPTLLIRDRREADEMRREMERRIQALKRARLRSTVMWLVAGILAFGLGGLVAVIVAKRSAPVAPAAEYHEGRAAAPKGKPAEIETIELDD